MGFPWRSLVFSRNREFCWILCDFCSILFSSEHKSAKKIPARPKIAALTRRRSATSRVCAVKTLAAVSLFVLFNCYVHHRVGYRNFHAKDWKIRRLYFSQLKDRYGVAPTLNVKLWNFEKLKTLPSICQKLDLTHWPKPPLPCSCPSRGGGRLDGSLIGPRCLCRILCNLIGPRCLCQISCNLIGPRCLCEKMFTKPGKPRRRPWCGASVGTTGSAPRAPACCPWFVLRGLCWNHWFRPSCSCVPPLANKISQNLFSLMSATKFHKICCKSTKFGFRNVRIQEENWCKSTKLQNFVDPGMRKREENRTQKQQNSTKFCGPEHAKTRRKVNAKTTKFHKIDKN